MNCAHSRNHVLWKSSHGIGGIFTPAFRDLATTISQNSFVCMTLIYNFSKLVDMSQKVSNMAGVTHRVSEIFESDPEVMEDVSFIYVGRIYDGKIWHQTSNFDVVRQNWLKMVGRIYDVKIWRQTSNFDVACQIGTRMKMPSHIWAILIISLLFLMSKWHLPSPFNFQLHAKNHANQLPYEPSQSKPFNDPEVLIRVRNLAVVTPTGPTFWCPTWPLTWCGTEACLLRVEALVENFTFESRQGTVAGSNQPRHGFKKYSGVCLNF